MNKQFVFLLSFLIVTASVIAQTAESYYDEGVVLKDAKKSKEAAEKFKQAITLKPDYTAAQYELGWCSNDTKDYTTALSSLRKAAKVWTTIPKVFFELGYAFDKLNMIDSAVYNYNKCINLKSDYSLAYKQLGMIAYQKDDYVTALDNFNKYEINTKAPISDYQYWYRKGFMQNAQKDFVAAKTALAKSLDFKTDYINTYLELGFASSRLKQNDTAIAYYQRAINLDPKSHIGYNGIAEVYRDNLKNMDESMNWYSKVIAMNPTERKACFGMGYCLNSKGRYTDAIPYLKKAIEMETTYTAAYVEIGYSYYMTSNNTEALANLNKALELNSKNENARYYKGLVYINQKDKENAQKMVDELKVLNSKNASVLQTKVTSM